jgi:hypothetical protein
MSRHPKNPGGKAAAGIGSQERSQIRFFVRTIYGHTLRFLKSLAARINLSHFPGSCGG